jgi:probable rRNA maturation factor
MTAITVMSESRVTCDEPAIVDMLAHHMVHMGIDPASPIGVTFVDEPHMTELHVEWMDEPGPTDVLSFPMDEVRSASAGQAPSFGVLGDIVVCLPVATKQAIANDRSMDQEVQFLVTHGFLHLLGFDHGEQAEYDEMFRLQDELLEGWRGSR